jgi:hypothetical protein
MLSLSSDRAVGVTVMTLRAEQHGSKREGAPIGRHLSVIARVPMACLALGEGALIAANAAEELRDHPLARHAC